MTENSLIQNSLEKVEDLKKEKKEACNFLIGIRIPDSQKQKYADLQYATNNKFSKVVSELVQKLIKESKV